MLTTKSLGRDTYGANMSSPHIRPAGITTSIPESAKDCLTWGERPTTPPEQRKYRQSTINEPGKIFRHPGSADDPIPQGTFGARSAGANQSVVDTINCYPDTEIGRWKLAQLEDVYASSKREPLGKGFERGYKIPAGLGTEQPFGCVYGAQEKAQSRQASTVIFPSDLPVEDESATHKQYLTSHADFAPGEQRHRNYNWDSASINPATHRFGAVDKDSQPDGVRKALQPNLNGDQQPTKIMPKLHEDFKATATDYLGKPKALGTGDRGLPQNFTYGVPSMRYGREPGVGELLCSGYSVEEQQPDADLGKSLREGFRNTAPEDRTFGVPSIRTDVPLPKMRSVANTMNYGNGPDAGQLLRPPKSAERGMEGEVFVQLRSRDEVAQLAAEAQMPLEEAEFAQVFAMASEADGGNGERCSLDTFFRARHHILAQTLVVPPPF